MISEEEVNKYEYIISKYSAEQLLYDRVIKLTQLKTTQKELQLIDEEMKRRLHSEN